MMNNLCFVCHLCTWIKQRQQAEAQRSKQHHVRINHSLIYEWAHKQNYRRPQELPLHKRTALDVYNHKWQCCNKLKCMINILPKISEFVSIKIWLRNWLNKITNCCKIGESSGMHLHWCCDLSSHEHKMREKTTLWSCMLQRWLSKWWKAGQC